MFIPCRADVGTYFRNVLRDVNTRGHLPNLVVIKQNTAVRNDVVWGVACSFFSGIPTARGGMLDQTLI